MTETARRSNPLEDLAVDAHSICAQLAGQRCSSRGWGDNIAGQINPLWVILLNPIAVFQSRTRLCYSAVNACLMEYVGHSVHALLALVDSHSVLNVKREPKRANLIYVDGFAGATT